MSRYTVRPIKKEDLLLILQWRNSERVHSQMLTDHFLTWEEHYQWFCRMKENPISRNLIFLYQDRPIGYIGYTEYDEERHQCAPSAYLGETDVPIDAGIILLYFAVDYAFSVLKMKRLETSIFEKNRQARQINTFLGYHHLWDKDALCWKNEKQEKVNRYAITYDEWDKCKKKVQKRWAPFKQSD